MNNPPTTQAELIAMLQGMGDDERHVPVWVHPFLANQMMQEFGHPHVMMHPKGGAKPDNKTMADEGLKEPKFTPEQWDSIVKWVQAHPNGFQEEGPSPTPAPSPPPSIYEEPQYKAE